MKIIIAGASGFIGTHLVESLKGNNEIVTVGRDKTSDIIWNLNESGPSQHLVDAVSGSNAIINLCGAGIGEKKWTDDYKKVLTSSRIVTTELLVEAIRQAKDKPEVFVCASGTPYKSHSGGSSEDEPLDDSFLAKLVEQWEATAQKASNLGVRVVNIRTGVVLNESGGFLKQIALPFKLCLGGKVGSGHQIFPWISMKDLVNIYDLAITDDHLNGPVNAVSPTMTTNLKFTKSYGRYLNRPTFLPTPVFLLKLIYGEELVNELMLKNNHVVPKKLLDLKFEFSYNSIDKYFKKDKTTDSDN